MPDHQPDRDKLGPTGPAKAPSDNKRSYDEKHPHAGTVEEHPGPPPTDDPHRKRQDRERNITKSGP